MRGPENTIKGTGTTMEPGTTMGAQEHKGAWGQQWGPHYKGPRDHKGCLGSHNIRAKGPQKGLETTMGPGDHNGIPVTRPEEHKGALAITRALGSQGGLGITMGLGITIEACEP